MTRGSQHGATTDDVRVSRVAVDLPIVLSMANCLTRRRPGTSGSPGWCLGSAQFQSVFGNPEPRGLPRCWRVDLSVDGGQDHAK
jgi:hypothetical protein